MSSPLRLTAIPPLDGSPCSNATTRPSPRDLSLLLHGACNECERIKGAIERMGMDDPMRLPVLLCFRKRLDALSALMRQARSGYGVQQGNA